MSWITLMISGTGPSTYAPVERYTEDARLAVAAAQQECVDRGGGMVTVSDLLAGLGYQENTRAERVGCLKANASYLRWLVCLPPLPARRGTENSPRPEFDVELRKALACAVVEADRDREYWIDSDHLLRGLMRFPNQADFALLKTELSLKKARELSKIDRRNVLPEQNPSFKVAEYLIRKHFALWVPSLVSLACYLYILIQTIGARVPLISR